MELEIDKEIYKLSCECKEAVYSNIEHIEFIRQMAKKLEALAKDIENNYDIAMQESSVG